MILIMAVLLIAARLALYTSFSLESAFLVDPIKGINILLVVLFGGTLFHEKDIFKKIIASLFMLGGAYLIVI
jgi:drug/metabolite transporter (DMT)-like permease